MQTKKCRRQLIQYIELVCCENFTWISLPEPAEIAFEYHRLFMIDSALMGQAGYPFFLFVLHSFNKISLSDTVHFIQAPLYSIYLVIYYTILITLSKIITTQIPEGAYLIFPTCLGNGFLGNNLYSKLLTVYTPKNFP